MNKERKRGQPKSTLTSAAFVYRHPAAFPSVPQNEALSLGRSPGW